MNDLDQIKRRTLIKRSLSLGLILGLPRLTGCGRVDEPFQKLDTSSDHLAATDLGDIFITQCGVLPEQVIVKNEPFTLHFREPSHKHDLALTPQHFEALRRGESIRVETARTYGHTHTVTIDPKRQPRFPINAVYAHCRELGYDKVPANRAITAAEMQTAKPITLALIDGEELLPFTVSASDLCALWGGVAVYDVQTEDLGGTQRNVALNPRFNPFAVIDK